MQRQHPPALWLTPKLSDSKKGLMQGLDLLKSRQKDEDGVGSVSVITAAARASTTAITATTAATATLGAACGSRRS